MNTLEEADLCIIEANYGHVLSDLEKRLIEELRAAREKSEENASAVEQRDELRDEKRVLEEKLEELEGEFRRVDAKATELREELDKLEDWKAKAREVLA